MQPQAVRSLRADVPAELEAVCEACLRKAGDERPAAAELGRWLDRLAAAANDAIAAARTGDSGAMRRHLRRFDALTSAIWTVQNAVYGSRVGAHWEHDR